MAFIVYVMGCIASLLVIMKGNEVFGLPRECLIVGDNNQNLNEKNTICEERASVENQDGYQQRLEQIIRERVDAEMKTIKKKFRKRMRKAKQKLERAVIRPCDVYYENFCYWTEYQPRGSVDVKKAESICRRRNSQPAYPVDEIHYNLLMENIRSRIPAGRSFWTGLKRNATTDEIFVRGSKKRAPFLKLYPDRASWESIESGVTLTVDKDPTNRFQGISVGPPLFQHTFGAICRYGLPL